MTDTLKPCPFCGANISAVVVIDDWWVNCGACEAIGPEAETRDAAITAWNTRTPTPREASLRQMLDEEEREAHKLRAEIERLRTATPRP